MPLNAHISPRTQKPCAIEVFDNCRATEYLLEHGVPKGLAKKIVDYNLTGGQFLFLEKAAKSHKSWTPRGKLEDDQEMFERYKEILHDLYVDPTVVQINLRESAPLVKQMFSY